VIDATTNIKQVEQKIKQITPKLLTETKKIFTINSQLLVGHIRKRHMTGGTTDTRLRNRSGHLSKSTKSEPVTHAIGIIKGGVSFGTIYAGVHIGPKGRVTTIRPKKAKMLTIPLPAAQTKAGVTRGSARSGRWGETFIAKSKKGNLILFGKKVMQRGARAGQTAGNIVPLFLLKKQVKVKTRIHPESILTYTKKKIIMDYEKIGVKLA
jgi:hypothetical protein